ncbi:hypothetical protein PTE31013_03517 [Pandoraea terrigena]|uniref:Uncharacterized protein n=1 Tax=Pandoraea terrigena TaxID=2508292 RepID=A0A5E4WY54_9BURK|nr:hypothetical protein PTE31013_03517 [Pandoraea terrigena]
MYIMLNYECDVALAFLPYQFAQIRSKILKECSHKKDEEVLYERSCHRGNASAAFLTQPTPVASVKMRT